MAATGLLFAAYYGQLDTKQAMIAIGLTISVLLMTAIAIIMSKV